MIPTKSPASVSDLPREDGPSPLSLRERDGVREGSRFPWMPALDSPFRIPRSPFHVPYSAFRIPRSAFIFLLLLLLPACSSTLEAVLEIETVGRERVETRGDAELHPLGDRLAVPAGAQEAFLRIGDGEEIPVKPGDEVELKAEDTAEAPGVLTRVRVGGQEIARAADRLKVAVRWRSVEVLPLTPKRDSVALELEPGQEADVDRTVMYTPMPGRSLEGVETRVRLSGPDADRMLWVEREPVRDGRVRGKVVARKG